VPSDKIMERLVRGGQHDFVETLLTAIAFRLSEQTCRQLEASLAGPKEATGFHALKGDVGAASLANILAACERLSFVKGLDLPFDILNGIDPAWVRRLGRLDASAVSRVVV
ncbi:MAG: Tn3 family transposase, partial [Pikeienuella sp.]